LAGTLVAAVLVSVTGAITALGDTLYPVDTSQAIGARLAADQSATASFFERGRAVHPVVALIAAAFIVATAQRTRAIRPYPPVERATALAGLLLFAQIGAGVANIVLSAPAYMQVVHLAIATALWLALVVLYATAMAEKRGHLAG